MSTTNDELLGVLKEIRDTLSRIYTCFEEQYLEIHKQKVEEELALHIVKAAKGNAQRWPLVIELLPHVLECASLEKRLDTDVSNQIIRVTCAFGDHGRQLW